MRRSVTENWRRAYDKGAAAAARENPTQPQQPSSLPSLSLLPTGLFAPSSSRPHSTASHLPSEAQTCAPASPFPGYRVPPGGYPTRASTFYLPPPHPPRSAQAPFGPDHALTDPDRLESVTSDQVEQLERIWSDLQEMALAPRYGVGRESHRHRRQYGPDPYVGEGGEYGGWRAGRAEEECQTARKEWTEAKTELNGDRVVSPSSLRFSLIPADS